MGETNEMLGSDTRVEIEMIDESDVVYAKPMISLSDNLKKVVQTGNPPYSFFFIIPIGLTIQSVGRMTITVYVGDAEIRQDKFIVELGVSPNIKNDSHLPQSRIFSGNDPDDKEFVRDLLGSSSKKLDIFDDYVGPVSLTDLLSNVDPSVAIRVLTLRKHKSLFDGDQTLLQRFPKMEVRYSDEVHDRFLNINDSEFFHLGHSLKDLDKGKLSRLSKIIDMDEIFSAQNLFQGIWIRSTV